MTELPRWDDMAVVGRVARAHGLRGQVVLNPETDYPETRFEPGASLYRMRGCAVERLQIASLRMHRGRPIVAFDGIDSIGEAEDLAGTELRVPVEWLADLPAGTFYVHDLVGCRVTTPGGGTVGSVERVEGDGGATRLVVTTEGGEVLVPLASDICREVDVDRKMIVVDPPEGLLELNRPGGKGSGQQTRRTGRPRAK